MKNKKIPSDKHKCKNNITLKNFFDNYFSKNEFSFENNETVVFSEDKLIHVMSLLENNDKLKFETLVDIIAVDYSDFGLSEWNAKNANNKGYSRGIKKDSSGRYTYKTTKTHYNQPKKRFAVIYNLLSIEEFGNE